MPYLRIGRALAGISLASLLIMAAPAAAETRDQVTPPKVDEIRLETGTASKAVVPEGWAQTGAALVAHNVSEPTLTPFLPPEDKRHGAAVVIAPGGGFMMLSMSNEGYDVARWLASQGVAAFVLKYRLVPTPPDFPGTMAAMRQKLFSGDEAARKQVFDEGIRLATEDSRAALRLVRANAAKWNIDPNKVGFMGFSAGAITALSLVTAGKPEDMPAFVAPVYGPLGMPATPLPDKLPPMWTAMSSDDPVFGKPDYSLVPAWLAKGGSIEFHLYQKGGHGYGFAGVPGTTTRLWPEQFLTWLRSNGLAGPAAEGQP